MKAQNIALVVEQLKKLTIDKLYTYENQKLVLNKLYRVGTIRIAAEKYFVDDLLDNGSYLLVDNNHNIQEGDIVLTKVIFNPRGKLKVKLAIVLIASQMSSLVYLKENKILNFKSSQEVPFEKTFLKKYKELDLFLLNNGKLEFLGNIQDPGIDDIIVLYKFKEEYRLKPYSYEIENSIDTANPSRVDLSNLDFCTIDPKTAKDHDDAIYYDEAENILYVAIADVSYYVQEGTSIDKEAYKRAFSAYFPNKVLPMLPFSLSAGICSLKPNQLRYAYVCKIYFDENHKVQKSEFIEAIIESKNNFSYEYIDDSIENKILSSSLESLFSVTQKLRKRRLKNGFDFRSIEYKLLLDNDENLVDIEEEKSSPSHHLVEECMLLANQEAAKKLSSSGIFRIHEEPDIKKIDTLIDKLKDFGLKIKKKANVHDTIVDIQKKAKNIGIASEVDKMIIEAQQQARYSSIKARHFGLGFDHYSHFTSPIRRYSDLVLHRMLKTDSIPKNIDEICEQISTTEREVTRMVWDLEERKYARWAKENINKVFEAKISDDGEHPKAQLEEKMFGLRGHIINYAGENLFSKIKVKIVSSNIITTKIEMQIVSI